MRLTTVFFIALSLFATDLSADELKIVNIRVGQGDSTLILGPSNAAGKRISVLFDAGDVAEGEGKFDGGRILGAVLAKNGVKSLDYVIVSHYDVDHIGGLVAGGLHGAGLLLGWNQTPGALGDDDNDGNDGWVGEKFFQPDKDEIGTGDDIPVGMFIDRGDDNPPESVAYKKYRLMATSMGERKSLNKQELIDSFEIDLGGGARMIALAGNGFVRDRTQRVANVDTENERSLSFLVKHGSFDFLISGDMIGRSYSAENARVEAAVGEYIESNGIVVDVLHVDHHGANNGSDTDFLTSIKPTIAVISSGNGNPHKHPHKETLSRLADANVYRIVQTAWGTTESTMPENVRRIQSIYQGDVVITTDGASFDISTSRTFKTDANPLREPL